MSICVMLSNISNSGGDQMLAVCMTLIDNDKDQTSFEDLYYRNRQIAYAFAYKILNNSALAEEACAKMT